MASTKGQRSQNAESGLNHSWECESWFITTLHTVLQIPPTMAGTITQVLETEGGTALSLWLIFIASLVPSLFASVPGLLLSQVHPHLRVNVLPVPLAWIPSFQVTSLGVVGVFLWCPLRMAFLSAHSTFLLFITTHTQFKVHLLRPLPLANPWNQSFALNDLAHSRLAEWMRELCNSGQTIWKMRAVFKNFSSGARCQLPSLVPGSWALPRSVSLSKICGY